MKYPLERTPVIAPRAAMMCAARLQLALLLGLALVLGPGDGAAEDGVEEDSIHGADSVEEDSFVTLMRSFGLRTPDPLATASPHWRPLCNVTDRWEEK